MGKFPITSKTQLPVSIDEIKGLISYIQFIIGVFLMTLRTIFNLILPTGNWILPVFSYLPYFQFTI